MPKACPPFCSPLKRHLPDARKIHRAGASFLFSFYLRFQPDTPPSTPPGNLKFIDEVAWFRLKGPRRPWTEGKDKLAPVYSHPHIRRGNDRATRFSSRRVYRIRRNISRAASIVDNEIRETGRVIFSDLLFTAERKEFQFWDSILRARTARRVPGAGKKKIRQSKKFHSTLLSGNPPPAGWRIVEFDENGTR